MSIYIFYDIVYDPTFFYDFIKYLVLYKILLKETDQVMYLN